MIEAIGLCVSAPDGRRILGPVTCAFGSHRTVVTGPSRSGKTTLFRALAGLLVPSAGRVLMNGEDLSKLDSAGLKRVRRSIGFVFQNDALFDSLDVLGNVMFPLTRSGVPRPEAEKRAREALDAVGLGDRLSVIPERLSGGMKKRLGLARAIVTRPQFLLADDPLAGLDPGTAAAMTELMVRLWSGDDGGLIIAAADSAPFEARGFQTIRLENGLIAHGPGSGAEAAASSGAAV